MLSFTVTQKAEQKQWHMHLISSEILIQSTICLHIFDTLWEKMNHTENFKEEP